MISGHSVLLRETNFLRLLLMLLPYTTWFHRKTGCAEVSASLLTLGHKTPEYNY